jgi:hypothetical protein
MLGVGWRGWGEGRTEEAEGKGMFFALLDWRLARTMCGFS